MPYEEALRWVNENMEGEDIINQTLVLKMLITGEFVICSFCSSAIDADEHCTVCGEEADRKAKVAAEQEWDAHDLRDTRY
ncbi:MAG: hypothetical protein ABIY70_09005 [Capsulimonas sp.]|uniref:hypothetical protein n=1 Tax=Capsulimonas sp. TaxID=2494211 RepID=UPI0032672B57